MDDLVVFAITMMTLGQIGYCLPQLLLRARRSQTYLPLAVFFVATGVITLGPVVSILLPSWITIYIAAIFPAWLLLAPALWLYVEGLTSSTPWRVHSKHVVQFVPFAIGIVVAALIVSLSLEERQIIFNESADINEGYPLVVVISMFLAMLLWAVQSGYYVIRTVVHLSKYRKRLKDLFASNEQRELVWLSWVLVIISGTWLLSFVSLIFTLTYENALFGYRFGLTLLLILVWTLSYWGLRQKPGFEGRYLSDKDIEPESISPDVKEDKKYKRSALSNEQAQRIAEKINATMEQEQLHLDSSLTLHKLAQHIAISPNYISQTLNETMGTNFFDFVNKWRVETAKPKIIANEDTVLNIALAVGFNARSSFYKVFKKETGKTPTEYRKAHLAQTVIDSE